MKVIYNTQTKLFSVAEDKYDVVFVVPNPDYDGKDKNDLDPAYMPAKSGVKPGDLIRAAWLVKQVVKRGLSRKDADLEAQIMTEKKYPERFK